MRAALPLLGFLLAGYAEARGPCLDDGGLGAGLGGAALAEVPCDAAEIEMARACRCVAPDEMRSWGPTGELSLELPARWRVASGRWTEIPVTLRPRRTAPADLDFPDGEMVRVTGIWKGKRRIEDAPCAELRAGSRAVRLSLRPGATVRGVLAWRASTSQHEWCREASDLAPGRYRIEVATVSGTPPLEASVELTVGGSRR